MVVIVTVVVAAVVVMADLSVRLGFVGVSH
jgi:hypothetical protein